MNIYTPIIHFADGSETGVWQHQTPDFELALAVCEEQYNSAVERNRTNTGHGSDVVKVTVRIDTLTEPEFIRWQKEQEILNMNILTQAQHTTEITTMKNYNEFQDYINMLAADFKASGYKYVEDFAHEVTDGSEYVIYYAKAWDLVTLVRESNYDLYSEGAEHASDCMSESTDLDQQIVSVAYWIIFTSVMQAVIKLALTEE